MGNREELDKQALQVDSLRRQGMIKAEIAAHLGISVRQVSSFLARAGRFYRRLVDNFDQEIFLGESMVTLSWMEKEALKNFEAMDAGDPLAVEWLQAALDINAQIVELMKIIIFGKMKSESGTSGQVQKSRWDRSRSRLRKLDKGKDRNLHCIRPEAQTPEFTEPK